MFVIPFKLNETEYSIFVALQDDNIERMRAYDPGQVNIQKTEASGFAGLRLKDIIFGYATQADVESLTETGADVLAVLRYLSRGFAFRPDLGDHDLPYPSAKADTEPV